MCVLIFNVFLKLIKVHVLVSVLYITSASLSVRRQFSVVTKKKKNRFHRVTCYCKVILNQITYKELRINFLLNMFVYAGL